MPLSLTLLKYEMIEASVEGTVPASELFPAPAGEARGSARVEGTVPVSQLFPTEAEDPRLALWIARAQRGMPIRREGRP